MLLSPQVERILGWKPEEIPDFTAWHGLVHPDDLPRCAEIWGVDTHDCRVYVLQLDPDKADRKALE